MTTLGIRHSSPYDVSGSSSRCDVIDYDLTSCPFDSLEYEERNVETARDRTHEGGSYLEYDMVKKGNILDGTFDNDTKDYYERSRPHTEAREQELTKNKLERSRKMSFEIVDVDPEQRTYNNLADIGKKGAPRSSNRKEKYRELPAWLGNRKPSFELFPDLNLRQESPTFDGNLRTVRPEFDQCGQSGNSCLENSTDRSKSSDNGTSDERIDDCDDKVVPNRRRSSKTLDFLSNADNFDLDESETVALSLTRKSPDKVMMNNLELPEHVCNTGNGFRIKKSKEFRDVDEVSNSNKGSTILGTEEKQTNYENEFHNIDRLPKRTTQIKRRRSKTMEFKRSPDLLTENFDEDLKPKRETNQSKSIHANLIFGTNESSIERNHDLVYVQNDLTKKATVKNREKENEIRWHNKLRQLEKHLFDSERRHSGTWEGDVDQMKSTLQDETKQPDSEIQGSKLLNFLMNSKHFDKASKQNLFQAPSSTFSNILKSTDGDEFQSIEPFEERGSSQDDEAIFMNLAKRSPKYGKYLYNHTKQGSSFYWTIFHEVCLLICFCLWRDLLNLSSGFN